MDNRAREGTGKTPLILAFVALLLILPFLTNRFVSDDYDLIRSVSQNGPFAIWSTYPANFFRPLISLSLWANHAAGGWNSSSYFVFNFALHALNVALVFLVARAFLGMGKVAQPVRTSNAISAFAAMFFMAMPAHSEALFFMACRTDLLAATFGLASASLFLLGVNKEKPVLIAWALASFAAGCLSKESVYAFVLFFGSVAFLIRSDKGRAKLALSCAVGALFISVVAFLIRSTVVVAATPYGTDGSSAIGLVKDAARLGIIFGKSAVPLDPAYAKGGLPSFDGASLVVMGFVLLVVAACSWRLFIGDRKIESPAIWPIVAGFVAAALPVCFLSVPVFSPENGRFTYLPSAFAAILVAVLIGRWLTGRSLQVVATFMVVLGGAFTYLNGLSYRQAGEVCDKTIAWLRSNKPDDARTVVLVLPDSVGGHTIWRNGAQSAAEQFAPAWVTGPHVITTYNGAPPAPGSTLDLARSDISQVSLFGLESRSTKVANAMVVIVSPSGEVRVQRAALVLLPLPKGAKP